ncbi:hypothetical protein CYLTODRAFT_338701, partial [Cylindrobasidium torrendii FP15055 ss-10]
IRQEFRELELLDEICKLHLEGKLPYPMSDSTRYAMIEDYRRYKGKAYVPKSVHSSISWSARDNF